MIIDSVIIIRGGLLFVPLLMDGVTYWMIKKYLYLRLST